MEHTPNSERARHPQRPPTGPQPTGSPGSSTVRLAAIALLTLLLVACTEPTSPDLDTWTDTWERARGIVPAQSELELPIAHETCSEVLGALREIRPELLPAPDPIITNTASVWHEHAEHVFFTCFDGTTDPDRVADAYDELHRLEAEVRTAIDTAR